MIWRREGVELDLPNSRIRRSRFRESFRAPSYRAVTRINGISVIDFRNQIEVLKGT